jgi:hypothetical protein
MISKRFKVRSLKALLAAVGGLCLAGSAHALVLDEFGAPNPGWARTASGAPDLPAATFKVCEAGLPVPGGVRDVYHRAYGNPLNSVTAVGVGEGRLSVGQGTGLTAETLVMYGAFTRVDCNPVVGGPRLGLDLSKYRSLRLVFSGAEDGLNLNVTYYTANPLDPAAPLYYSGGGINIAPNASGGALEARLPAGTDPNFNWRQVDGIVIIINRSGPTPHTSYTLDRVVFSTQP